MFRKATPEDIHYVAMNMRSRDYDEIVCVSWAEDRAQLAQFLVNGLSDHDNVYCFYADAPIAILSYIPMRPGVWNLGMFATDKIKKVGGFLTKTIIRDIIPALDSAKAHRVECQSIEGYEQVHKWLEFIGLKKEKKIPGYGRNKENFYTFSYVREDQKPGSLKWQRGEIA